jgi:hypothetical protein
MSSDEKGVGAGDHLGVSFEMTYLLGATPRTADNERPSSLRLSSPAPQFIGEISPQSQVPQIIDKIR